VQSVRLSAGCSQVLSCGTDHWLVATDIDTGLMDTFAEGFAALQKAAGRSAGGSARLLQALQWHMDRGIVQVGLRRLRRLRLLRLRLPRKRSCRRV
jgi:hypothetical protein